MEHVEYYLASDGERFYTAEECMIHEMMPSHDVLDGMRLLKEDFSEVVVSQKDEKIWDGLAEDVYFVRLDNEEAVKWLEKIGSYIGCTFPNKRGTFYYNESGNDWCCIEDQLEYLAKIRRALTE